MADNQTLFDPSPTDGSRSERPRVQERVSQIILLMLQGATLRDIREYAREKQWGVSLRQIKRYKTVAQKELDRRFEAGNDRVVRQHLNRLEFLYQKATTTGDLRTAVTVLRNVAELRGLYPAKPGTFPVEIVLSSFQAVDKLVGDLIEDEAAWKTYRDAMRGILTALQATIEKG